MSVGIAGQHCQSALPLTAAVQRMSFRIFYLSGILNSQIPSPDTAVSWVLQKQCNLLAYSVARASGGGDKRVRNLGRSLLGILGVSSQLQRLLGVSISAGHEAHTREALVQLQRAVAD